MGSNNEAFLPLSAKGIGGGLAGIDPSDGGWEEVRKTEKGGQRGGGREMRCNRENER